ncbi:MAG: DivIVA domain-containing protein, partial [Clostridia bacterium]|nr:DivIVA domain-containing protein [Clostridia bacterium]
MTFSIEKKGYSTYEVDAYIEDLEAKCQTLKEQNAILEQKLATAKRLIRRFSDTENALKQSIADSKRAAAYMISDARERSETLL